MKGSILTFATVIKLSFWLLSPTLSAPSTPSLSVTISSLISQYLRYYCKTSFNSLIISSLNSLSLSYYIWASSTLRLSATMRSLNSLSLSYYQLPQLSISPLLWPPSTLHLHYFLLLKLSVSPLLWPSSTLHLHCLLLLKLSLSVSVLWALWTLRLSATMSSFNYQPLSYYQLFNLPISPLLLYKLL